MNKNKEYADTLEYWQRIKTKCEHILSGLCVLREEEHEAQIWLDIANTRINLFNSNKNTLEVESVWSSST